MAGKSGVDFLRRGTVSPVLGSGDRERVCGCVELGWTRLGTEGGSGMGEGPEGEGPYGLESGLGGRACSALCWRLRMLRSQVQLLYVDGSALLGFLRDSPVFGTSGQRESRGIHFLVFFPLASDSRNSAQIMQRANHFFSLLCQ